MPGSCLFVQTWLDRSDKVLSTAGAVAESSRATIVLSMQRRSLHDPPAKPC